MKDRTLKSNLYHSLGQEVQPKRLGETINYCTEIMKEQMFYKEEPRTSFFQYLSDVFRFEGIPDIYFAGGNLIFCLSDDCQRGRIFHRIFQSLCHFLWWLLCLFFSKASYME